MRKKQVCIIGLGLFGSELARSLAKDCEVLGIDNNEAAVEAVSDDIDRAVILDATNYDALSSVISSDFDEAVIGMSEHLDTSILCALHLKKLGVKRVTAKAMNADHETVLRAIGADEVIFPEKDSAHRLALRISQDNLLDFIPIVEGYNVMDVIPPEWTHWQSLIDLQVRKHFGIFVMAVKEKLDDKFVFLPGPEFTIKSSDVLVLIGRTDQIEAFRKSVKAPKD